MLEKDTFKLHRKETGIAHDFICVFTEASNLKFAYFWNYPFTIFRLVLIITEAIKI